MKRRSFLKVAGGCALGSGTLSGFGAQVTSAAGDTKADLPRRVLGRAGEKVSVIGFPGLSLVQQGQEEGTAGIHKAFDQGINYFDVAPAYGRDGECEIKMGVGLQGLDRSRIFLACKTKKRDKQGAREELERSLTRLKTDHFDLYQMHAVFTPQEARQALGPGGAIETFLEVQKEGKIRFFGFSAHTTKGALETAMAAVRRRRARQTSKERTSIQSFSCRPGASPGGSHWPRSKGHLGGNRLP